MAAFFDRTATFSPSPVYLPSPLSPDFAALTIPKRADLSLRCQAANAHMLAACS